MTTSFDVGTAHTSTTGDQDEYTPRLSPSTADGARLTERAQQAGTSPRRRAPLYIRVIAVLAVLLTGWHIFASFLWISPYSHLRELVPGKALSSWMIPMFGQSWSVFAPEPINGNYRLLVRAELSSGDATDWVDATAADHSRLTHNLFPSRQTGLANEVSSRYKNAWEELSPEQREVVQRGYYSSFDWLDRLQQDLREVPVPGDVGEAVNAERITELVSEERRAAAFSTQVAYALWGDDVVHVQYEVSRQNVIPFAERNNPDAIHPDRVIVPSGWRGTYVVTGQDQDRFKAEYPIEAARDSAHDLGVNQ
ncbi:hypothetical protein U746_0876 [Mycolicibacterium mucogenicum 261Sha1.1M5]|nr:hypothetical protein U746_0876 [Mycolicibacterium mucogenicum 261Sha1.1M5]